MKFINFVLGFFTISLIIGISFSYFVGRTLLSAKYLDQTAQDSGFYAESSQQIYNQIKDNADLSKKEQVVFNQKIQTLITPTYIQTKFSKALYDGENYLKNGGELPVIDISDLKTNLIQQNPELKNATIPDRLTFPEEFTKNIQRWYPSYSKAKLGSDITLGIIIVLLLFIAVKRRNFSTLAKVLILAGTFEIGLSFAAKTIIETLKNKIVPSDEFDQLIKSVEKIIQKIANDLNHQNLIIGISLIVIGILVLILQKILFRQSLATHKLK